MITGAHLLLYSTNPEADRAFIRDVLEFHSVDVGHGWLIFALPRTEMAVHPAGGDSSETPMASLYLMCDDLPAVMRSLAARNVHCAPMSEAGWGIMTAIPLPGGGEIGLYQPKHPTAIGIDSK